MRHLFGPDGAPITSGPMIERKARAYIHTHGHFALVMAWKNAEAAKNEADEKFWLDVCHKIDTIQEGG